MKKTILIALTTAILIYCSGLVFTYYSNIKFKERVAFYDKDNNGVIENQELTKDAQETAKQIGKHKTIDQATIMLIPVALIFGLFGGGMYYLFRKIKYINNNEIDYKKQYQH